MSKHSNSSPIDTAHIEVKRLIANFNAHRAAFCGQSYSEAQARKDFIDPLFEAMGWDVNHRVQRNPFEQEVIVERNVSTGQGQKRADYAFYFSPNFRDVRFFVEAKKPSIGLQSDTDALFQTVRYGWNARATLSVLTNFAQIIVMDCRSRPDPATASSRIIHRYSIDELQSAEIFARFYWLFSREAHESGSYERFCTALPKPRGVARQLTLFRKAAQPVDEAFLDDLEHYRGRLASLFKKADHNFDSVELTEATQRTLDRLIFLRFLEDKLIETKIKVSQFGATGSAWQDFIAASRRLDAIYNGIVYKKHSIVDNKNLAIDDGEFADICEQISDSNSPYDFNAIPIHILGSIYERFLGQVIVATAQRARVEPKPEVRKAGGVYYTPEYIVHHVVEETVGRLLHGKTPRQVLNLRFCDISCGSGSFLLGVADAVFRYVTSWYNKNPSAAKKDGCVRRTDGTWRLSLHQKRELISNTIYGVDIDHQAVEVTQLSLYLKLLEDETTASAYEQQLEFEETLLPPLSKNIVSGNSLVDLNLDRQLFDIEDKHAINPFDFELAFPEVFAKGGFDAIVGNPPYIRIQTLSEIHPATAKYVKGAFKTAQKGSFDLYACFVERGLELLNQGGTLGFIVPNKFHKTDYGEALRSLIAEQKALRKVIDFGSSQVFQATTYTCLLFLTRSPAKQVEFAACEASSASLEAAKFDRRPAKDFGATPWSFTSQQVSQLMEKLQDGSVKLLDLPAEMSRGSSSGADEAFLINEQDTQIEQQLLRTPLFASDFGRFDFNPQSGYKIIFPYRKVGGKFELISEAELKRKFPNAFKHLLHYKKPLEARAQYKEWWAYSAPRNLSEHDRASIAVPLLANKGLAALVPDEWRGALCPMASGGFTISFDRQCERDPRYVLGLLNSAALFWYLQNLSNIFRGGWITCTKQYYGALPIKVLKLSSQRDRTLHDAVVQIVDDLADNIAELRDAKSDQKRERCARDIAHLEQRLNKCVATIYGLTDEEELLIA